MAGSFTAVKAPPQTLEHLDSWGKLDSLPWSLDDGVWTTAGEYALTFSDAGKSGQGSVFVRKKVITLTGAAKISGNGVWTSVILLSLSGTAKAGGSIQGERLRPVYGVLSGTCSGSGAFSVLRIRTDAVFGAVSAEASAAALRIRQDTPEGIAESGEGFSPVRVRLISITGEAVGGQSEIFLRVTPLLTTEPAESGEEIKCLRVRMTDLAGREAVSSESKKYVRVRCVIPDTVSGAGSEEILPEYKGWSWVQCRQPKPAEWNCIGTSSIQWEEVVQWQ